MAALDALLQLQRLMAPGGPGSALPSRPQDTTYYSDINPRPSGLPDAVRESILQGRSYGEGQVIPRPPEQTPFNYRNFAIEGQQYSRERERLSRELDFLRGYNDLGNPLKEGRAPSAAPDPYSRPYNLGLGNLGALF